MSASVRSLSPMNPWSTATRNIVRSESVNVVCRSPADPSRSETSSAVATAASLIRVERRRVAELSELWRASTEEQAHRPVDHQPQAARHARHQQQVVGTRGEPGREAADAYPQHLRDGLMATHVDEDTERLVRELLRLPVAERRRDVRVDQPALPERVLCGGWRWPLPAR